jgi:hypothetical protein
MSRNRVSSNVAPVGGLVNVAITLIAVALIGSCYLSAVGQFVGVA